MYTYLYLANKYSSHIKYLKLGLCGQR